MSFIKLICYECKNDLEIGFEYKEGARKEWLVKPCSTCCTPDKVTQGTILQKAETELVEGYGLTEGAAKAFLRFLCRRLGWLLSSYII